MNDPIELFRQAIAAAGLTAPENVEADGAIHRFDSGERKGKRNGWYTLHLDGIPAGAFGCWRMGIEQSWCAKTGDSMSEGERAAYAASMEAMRVQRATEAAQRQAEAKAECAKLWELAKPCTDGGHAYLKNKGVKPYGLRLLGDRLLVPLRVGGELVSLQFIGGDGTKRFKTGGQVAGALCAIGKPSGQDGAVIVCEGFATGASLHECTGHAVAVAFNAGNLEAVAKAVRLKLPRARLIVAADNDVDTEGNPGLSKAMQAAKAVGALVAVPDFGQDRPIGATDFNDLHQLNGAQAVRTCIDAAQVAADSIMPVASGEDLPPQTGGEWECPEPLPTALPPVPPFDFELLPEQLRGWVKDIAHRMQCPPDFVAVGALVALSSVVGAKVQIYPKARDNWAVVPNLWGMAIGRPGVKKSPALGEVLKPLERLEAAQREQFEQAIEAFEALQVVREFEQAATRKEVAKQAGKGDAKALAQRLMEGEKDPKPTQKRYIVNDSSVEALTELLRENPWGLLAFRDELAGLIDSMGREGQEGARAFYLSAFDGNKSHTVDRIGRGSFIIPRACVAMLGGIQPGKLQTIVRGATVGGGMDDGLLQRFQLAVWPDIASDYKNVDQWPDTACKEAANALFDRLAQLPEPEGDVPTWRFCPKALTAYVEWTEQLEAKLRGGELHDAMQSHLSKFGRLAPALALMFALIDTPQDSAQGQAGIVGETELVRALAWTEYLEAHAVRIYAAATRPETGAALALLKRIRGQDLGAAFTPRQVAQKHWALLESVDEVKQACQVLEDYGWGRTKLLATGAKGGRPSLTFLVNPLGLDPKMQTEDGA